MMDKLFNRVMRAALLDKEFFKEAEADTSLNQEALLVVILVSVAGGIGAFINGLMNQGFGAALLGLIVASVIGVVNYYIWAYVTHFIGTNLFKGEADPGELLRVLGYASGPRLLSVLGFIPCIGGLISLAGGIWALVAGFFGVREALDLDTTETLVTVVLGWLVILIISAIISGIFGVGAVGLGAALSAFRR
jgi:hypothetical protein